MDLFCYFVAHISCAICSRENDAGLWVCDDDSIRCDDDDDANCTENCTKMHFYTEMHFLYALESFFQFRWFHFKNSI